MIKALVRAALVVLFFCVSNVWAQSETVTADPRLPLSPESEHPLIPLSKFLQNQTLPRYESPAPNVLFRKGLIPEHLDMTDYLGVVGKERDQGNCGSCWVWSGIGCLEGQFNKALQDGVFNGVNYVANQKFSINYVEARYKMLYATGNVENAICEGGKPEIFASFFQLGDGYDRLVPKSNYNANATFSGLAQDTNKTNVFELIQKDPYVGLNNFQLLDVVTDYNNPEQAKQEVIQALNDGYFVQMDYFVYSNFQTSWSNEDEETQYYFPESHGDPLGGHAVIIVGYDISDPDPDNHYWIVQNSWGISAKRPKGQIRFNINSGFGNGRVMEYVIYKTNFGVENESCDNLDNDCNTVIDDECEDYCLENDEKTVPGVCGCDTSDLDQDQDGTPDCIDECPNNSMLTAPGVCGCDGADDDSDGTLNCVDGCPDDPAKVTPSICGCGTEDSAENIADSDDDGIINCHEDDFLKFKDVKFGPLYRASETDFNESKHKKLDYQINQLCAQTTTGDLYCMGYNAWGQLGDGTKTNRNSLVLVKNLKNVTNFSLGNNHACAISNSKVYCWGFNRDGELGRGNGSDDVHGPVVNDQWDPTAFSLTPTEITYDIDQPKFVTCGVNATCVTTESGDSYCFGRNEGGKLGVKGWMYPLDNFTLSDIQAGRCLPDGWDDLSGTIMFNGSMAAVPLSNVTGMAMSNLETVTIADGVLYNYGLHHDLKSYPPAARYDEFTNLTAVSKSETDLCAINSSGELYCLDTFITRHFNPFLKKMTPNSPRTDYPVKKIPLENVSMVSCGSAIRNILSFYFPEDSQEKKNENPTYTYGLTCDMDPPVELHGLLVGGAIYFYQISADKEAHICAVSNGDLYCWGRQKDAYLEEVGTNYYGQLGSYDRTLDYDTPKKVEGISNVTALATSGGVTCYISNGELFCFGDLIPLGIDREKWQPCRITKANRRVADFIHAGDDCEYIGNTCGKYSYRNGNYICKPCSEDVEYGGDLEEIPNCADDLGRFEPAPTPTPTPTPAFGKIIVNVVDENNNPIQNETVQYFDNKVNKEFVTNEKGKVNIPVYLEQTTFYIKIKNSKGTIINNDLEQCYNYDRISNSGTFDYSENNNLSFTFVKKTFNKNVIRFYVKDNDTGEGLSGVSVNLNGTLYTTDSLGNAWINEDDFNFGHDSNIDFEKKGYKSITLYSNFSESIQRQKENGCYYYISFDYQLTREDEPTVDPTQEPTSEPTVEPTQEPTVEPTVEPTSEPTIKPTPTVCPNIIETNITAKKSGKKKIKVSMKKVDNNCFEGTFIYQVRLIGNGKKTVYNSNKMTLTTKKLKKGTYKVSYRVMRKVKRKKNNKAVLKPASSFSKVVRIKIK